MMLVIAAFVCISGDFYVPSDLASALVLCSSTQTLTCRNAGESVRRFFVRVSYFITIGPGLQICKIIVGIEPPSPDIAQGVHVGKAPEVIRRRPGGLHVSFFSMFVVEARTDETF